MRKFMKVILLQKVTSLGDKGEVKDVAVGYARNYLMPKGLVKEATPQALAELQASQAKEAKLAETQLHEAESLAQKLEGQVVELKAKASDQGTLFAAVSPTKIVSALKSKGFDVKKEQIMSASHIKETGEHEIVVKLAHGLEARITLIVNSE